MHYLRMCVRYGIHDQTTIVLRQQLNIQPVCIDVLTKFHQTKQQQNDEDDLPHRL